MTKQAIKPANSTSSDRLSDQHTPQTPLTPGLRSNIAAEPFTASSAGSFSWSKLTRLVRRLRPGALHTTEQSATRCTPKSHRIRPVLAAAALSVVIAVANVGLTSQPASAVTIIGWQVECSPSLFSATGRNITLRLGNAPAGTTVEMDLYRYVSGGWRRQAQADWTRSLGGGYWMKPAQPQSNRLTLLAWGPGSYAGYVYLWSPTGVLQYAGWTTNYCYWNS